MPIRIFLVEDQDIARQSLKAMLATEPELEIVGEAGNAADAMTKISTLTPDLVLIDLNMPVINGLDGIRLIRHHFPAIKILVLASQDPENYLVDMLSAGANGYMLKNPPREDLVYATKKLMRGETFISTEFTLNMLAKYKAGSGMSANTSKKELNITDREMDVLNLIAQGLTNTETARRLFTSVRTIETRRKNLLEKTGTTNTATLIRYAILNGLIK